MVKSALLLLTLAISTSGFAEDTLFTKIQQLHDESGRVVTIQGIYNEMLLPKSKRPDSPLIKTGRIVITLEDGAVALETHAAGLRSEEEKANYLGKVVKVSGTFFRMRQLFGQPHEQAIVHPAIVDIKTIE